MREGKELILATKPYAIDQTLRSWWCILSTAFLLIAALVGTLWHFPFFGEDRLQPSCRPADFKTVRHLSRPAAQGDLTEFSLGRRLYEDLWHLCFESHQH